MKLDPFEANIDDLSSIVSSARAVALAAADALPSVDAYSWERMNYVGDLLNALDCLLKLAELHNLKLVDDPRLRAAA